MNFQTAMQSVPGRRFLCCLVAGGGFGLALQLLAPRVLPLYSGSERFHAWVLLMGALVIWLRRRDILWRIALPAAATLTLVLGVSFQQAAAIGAGEVGTHVGSSDTFWRLALAFSIFVIYTALSAAMTFALQLAPRTRQLLQTPRGFWLRGVRALIGLALISPYAFASFNAHRSKLPNNTDPLKQCGLSFESVRFKSDGIPIEGWFIPRAKLAPGSGQASPDNATVIVCHGIGANKGAFLGLAPFLHRAGFNVLFFDFRGHGDSGGHTVTFGVDESRDLLAAADYLQSRDISRLALYAFSMGGAAALRAAPQMPNVRCVVTDSTFIDFPPLVEEQFAQFSPLTRHTVMTVTNVCSRIEIGASLGDISPRPYVAAISPRPLLIIHGTADSLIPVVQAHDLFAATQPPRELYIVQGAQHCLERLKDPPPYEKRVAAFLRRGLKG